MKKQKFSISESNFNHFDLLSEEMLFSILDCLDENPADRKSFSLVCKAFYHVESHHRKTLKPKRSLHLTRTLKRYRHVSDLDLSLCLRITDCSLTVVSGSCRETLRSINLSRSKFFTHVGLSNLVMGCRNLVEIDLSNAIELTDMAAAVIAEAKNLEKLLLVRCKGITDIGIGCIAVGCKKLRLLNLRWCLGVGDLGVCLIAVKCKDIRSLDLSYLPISNNCLSSILKLPNLEDLSLEGCYGIDDDSLIALKQGCKSLEKLNMSSCQNVSPVGLSSLTSSAGCIRQLTLSYGSPVTLALSESLQKLSMLQSVKLDGCQVKCCGLKAIGNWSVSLRELSLSKCPGVTDEGLCSIVTKHRELLKLDITCCRKITHKSISNITNFCSSLTSLRMESCALVPREAFVLIGQRCKFLEELDLTDNEIDDEGLESISKCSGLLSLKLGICLNISDKGLVPIGECCPKLKELDLYRSFGVTDSGIDAIAHGCLSLEMINIAYCNQITDHSFVSLSKCLNLSTLESRGCPLLTSSGLAALAVGCRLLTKLDIKKCHNIDDAGMISLAHFSQNLREINLSYTSVTDLGLLSLASISSLQSMTAVQLKGLSLSALAASLFACGGLTNVKLSSSFKSVFPQPLLDHLQVRGCAVQWSDKVCRAELDPKCWKLQMDDME
ncbi:unnamed protein product [Cuscuta europaea]|uniref:F-box/LRR-repeat protein 15-like leucin rich repeat domain-containing protein n=1 Tax=Cuscuta europaea TaxID=41803 RepID=A0A9P0ZIX5_CUSEU|nr:unnamed protein product [Cuscuta europaea]